LEPGLYDEDAEETAQALVGVDYVRMVPVGPRVAGHELIDEGLTGLHQALAAAGQPVHSVGGVQAMEIEAGGGFHLIVQDDLHRISLDGMNHRPRYLAVISEAGHILAFSDLPGPFPGEEMHFLEILALLSLIVDLPELLHCTTNGAFDVVDLGLHLAELFFLFNLLLADAAHLIQEARR